MAAYLQWTYGGTPLAPALMARLMGSAGERTGSISCESAKVAVYFALMRGDVEAAKFHVSYLLDRGYFEPGFIRICRQKNLCNAP